VRVEDDNAGPRTVCEQARGAEVDATAVASAWWAREHHHRGAHDDRIAVRSHWRGGGRHRARGTVRRRSHRGHHRSHDWGPTSSVLELGNDSEGRDLNENINGNCRRYFIKWPGATRQWLNLDPTGPWIAVCTLARNPASDTLPIKCSLNEVRHRPRAQPPSPPPGFLLPTPPHPRYPWPRRVAATPWWRLAGTLLPRLPPSALPLPCPPHLFLPPSEPRCPPLSPLPNLTARLTDLIRDPNQAEAPLSPTTSAPERTEEDSAAVAVARSNRSPEDTTAQKGGGFCAFRLLGLVGVGLESNSWASDVFLQIKEGLKQLC
jgi:hypothetical protein